MIVRLGPIMPLYKMGKYSYRCIQADMYGHVDDDYFNSTIQDFENYTAELYSRVVAKYPRFAPNKGSSILEYYVGPCQKNYNEDQDGTLVRIVKVNHQPVWLNSSPIMSKKPKLSKVYIRENALRMNEDMDFNSTTIQSYIVDLARTVLRESNSTDKVIPINGPAYDHMAEIIAGTAKPLPQESATAAAKPLPVETEEVRNWYFGFVK